MRLILCAALAAMCGAAGAEVNKCVDQEGHVLFTDVDCPQTASVSPMSPALPASPVSPALPASSASSPKPEAVSAPRSRWADLPRPIVRKNVSIDASTLQTAHQSMLLQDELHKSRRLLSAR